MEASEPKPVASAESATYRYRVTGRSFDIAPLRRAALASEDYPIRLQQEGTYRSRPYPPPLASTATAAASTTTASTMAAAPAASTTAAVAAAVSTAPASATSATFALRTRFVDDERAAQKFLAIQSCDGFFGFAHHHEFRQSQNRAAGP